MRLATRCIYEKYEYLVYENIQTWISYVTISEKNVSPVKRNKTKRNLSPYYRGKICECMLVVAM